MYSLATSSKKGYLQLILAFLHFLHLHFSFHSNIDYYSSFPQPALLLRLKTFVPTKDGHLLKWDTNV